MHLGRRGVHRATPSLSTRRHVRLLGRAARAGDRVPRGWGVAGGTDAGGEDTRTDPRVRDGGPKSGWRWMESGWYAHVCSYRQGVCTWGMLGCDQTLYLDSPWGSITQTYDEILQHRRMKRGVMSHSHGGQVAWLNLLLRVNKGPMSGLHTSAPVACMSRSEVQGWCRKHRSQRSQPTRRIGCRNPHEGVRGRTNGAPNERRNARDSEPTHQAFVTGARST